MLERRRSERRRKATRVSRDRLEEAQHGGSSTRVCMRRKGSRPQSEGGGEDGGRGGGTGRPRGGINERIDLGVQHTSAVLSLSVQVDLRDRAAMDLQLHLGCICMNVNKRGSEGGSNRTIRPEQF